MYRKSNSCLFYNLEYFLYFVKNLTCTILLLLAGPDWEPDNISDYTARVWCPDLLQEGHWHHIVLVLNRAVLKNSALSIYVDGNHIHTQKVILIDREISRLFILIF